MSACETSKPNPELLAEVDVVVLGGGVAGVAAAIASARGGAKTLLVERDGCLGGAATLGLVTPLSATSSTRGHSFGGLGEELLKAAKEDTMRYCGGEPDSTPSPHVLKHTFLRKTLEAGAELLFHAYATGVQMDASATNINALKVHSKSGEGLVKGKFFIDASGDADILFFSGEDFVKGSEPDVLRQLAGTGLDKIHEDERKCVSYSRNGAMQPVSIMFDMGGVDRAKASPYVNKTLTYADVGLTRDAFQKLVISKVPGFEPQDGSDLLPLPQGRVLFFNLGRDGEVVVNMTRVLDIDGCDVKDLSRAEVVAQRQVFAVMDFLKDFIPGFENAHLIDTAASVGVRETRRLVGRHVLNGREVVDCIPNPEVIAHGSYIIDIHDPCGRRKAIGGPIKGDRYDIPYGSLLPKKIRNLLVSGRCISADHVAHSSSRVQGTCLMTGQAAGAAAAIAIVKGLANDAIDIKELQENLIASGVALEIRR